MTKVQMSAELYNAVMNTLAARPYAEVHRLIAAIEQERVVINDDAPKAEEVSAQANGHDHVAGAAAAS